jgi:hypothetical protein
MADAYGTLVMSKSEDCRLDVHGFVNELNLFKWDNESGKWQYEDDFIFFDTDVAQYPTVFPSRLSEIRCFCENTDTNYTKASLSEMSDQDWENWEETVFEECELIDIKNSLSKYINSGWVEIACVSNEKQRYINFGLLRIEANGLATRKMYISGPVTGSHSDIETV